MSREIKFRAWVEWTEKPRFEYSENNYPDTFWNDYDDGDNVEQYTGFKDKNGKEIYEGDIVKCYSKGKLLGEYQVIWNEDCGGFECESLKPLVDGGGSMLKDIRVFCEMSIQFRVIGNIHENAELLGDEK